MDWFARLTCCQTSPVPFFESRKDIKRLSTPVQSRFSSQGLVWSALRARGIRFGPKKLKSSPKSLGLVWNSLKRRIWKRDMPIWALGVIA